MAVSERARTIVMISDPRTVRGSGPHGVSKVRNRGLPNSAAHRRGRRPPRGPPATLRAPATHTGAVLPGRPARFAWPPRPRRAPAPPPRRRAARGPTERRRYGVNPAVNPRDTAALLLVDNVQCTRGGASCLPENPERNAIPSPQATSVSAETTCARRCDRCECP